MGKVIEEVEKYYCDICGDRIENSNSIEFKQFAEEKDRKKYFCWKCLEIIEVYLKEREGA